MQASDIHPFNDEDFNCLQKKLITLVNQEVLQKVIDSLKNDRYTKIKVSFEKTNFSEQQQ